MVEMLTILLGKPVQAGGAYYSLIREGPSRQWIYSPWCLSQIRTLLLVKAKARRELHGVTELATTGLDNGHTISALWSRSEGSKVIDLFRVT